MRFPRVATAAVAILLSAIVVASSVASQTSPDSLKFVYGAEGNGVLFLKSGGAMGDTAQSPAGQCGNAKTGPLTTTEDLGTWTFDPTTVFPAEPALTGNGTGPPGPKHYTAIDGTWTLKISFRSTQADQAQTTGFRLSGVLKLGGASGDPTFTAAAKDVSPSQDLGDQTLTFVIDPAGNNTAHSGGPISVNVKVGPPAQGQTTLPGTVNNFVVDCNQNSNLSPVGVYRGAKGDGDQDSDGVPDPDDTDKDGDGMANAAETALAASCKFKGDNNANLDLASNKAAARDDHDADGVTDKVECDKGSNPLSATSVPAKEKTLLEILMPFILIIVLLALIAGIIFVFLKYGKTVRLTVATTSELFVPAGTKGKYEIAVENLAKKGEARTFQLVASGMPEGWDAKLNTDHLTLDPVGGAQNRGVVWLEVEAPQRPEPESAVVAVKAVPLNKAGRKDTLKLPGKAETITSINVPPGSKVPVKRGGKIEAAEAEEGGMAAGGVPIAQLGVDDAAAKKLTAAGIENSEQLRTADAAALHKKTKIPEATLDSWQKVSDLVRLGMTAPQANGLVVGGITSVGALANADPKEVSGKAGVDEKTGKAWVKAAGKWVKQHPAEAVGGAAAPAAAVAATPAAPGAAPAASGAKPQLHVGGLKHEPPAFRQGETVKSSVNVTNNGAAVSTIKLSLYVNEGLADVQTVTVKPGKAKDVQFKWTAQEKNKLNIRGEVVPS
ncbi:MAG: DUF4332 domain-containing protein [Euryarchaeota archaeon]|nr:DUF4332 domain-containing protein [Euryarchaeota archaeon]